MYMYMYVYVYVYMYMYIYMKVVDFLGYSDFYKYHSYFFVIICKLS